MSPEEFYPCRPVSKADMEIIKNLLKTHFGVDAVTEPIPTFTSHNSVLYVIAKALDAKIVVEIGTGRGGSCRAFVTALKETGGKLYSIDSQPKVDPVIKETIRRHADDPVTFISGDGTDEGKKWDKGDIDILYQDNGHGYRDVISQLEVWNKYNPKVILVHDTLVHGRLNEPYRAAEEFARRSGRKFANLTFTAGLGVII